MIFQYLTSSLLLEQNVDRLKSSPVLLIASLNIPVASIIEEKIVLLVFLIKSLVDSEISTSIETNKSLPFLFVFL